MAFQKGDKVKAADYLGHISSKDFQSEQKLSIGGGLEFVQEDSEGYFWVRSDGTYDNVRLSATAGTGANSRARLYSVDFDAGGGEVKTLLYQVFDDTTSDFSVAPGYYYFTLRVSRNPGPFDGATAQVFSKPWQNTIDIDEQWSVTKLANSDTTTPVTFSKVVTVQCVLSSPLEDTSLLVEATNTSTSEVITRSLSVSSEVKTLDFYLSEGEYSIRIDVQSTAGVPASSVDVTATHHPRIRKYLDDLSDLVEVGGTSYEGGISFQDATNGLLGDGTLPGGIYGEESI